jgi:amino acid transporter
MPNPGRTLPRVMFLTMVIGALTSFLWAFAFMFAATDLAEVAASKLPVLTLYAQSLNNDSIAVFFVVWLCLICMYLPFQISPRMRAEPEADRTSFVQTTVRPLAALSPRAGRPGRSPATTGCLTARSLHAFIRN